MLPVSHLYAGLDSVLTSIVYYVWVNGTVTNKNTPTPTWMLAFGAGMLVIGLATYGYVSPGWAPRNPSADSD
jgi:hypothetical protein